MKTNDIIVLRQKLAERRPPAIDHHPGACGFRACPGPQARLILSGMFSVDEATAAAVCKAFEESGELSAVVELRRHFPGVANNANARLCVRAIAAWQPLPP